jgi:hypothetical protein
MTIAMTISNSKYNRMYVKIFFYLTNYLFDFFCKFVSNNKNMGLPELKNKVLMYIENTDEIQLAKVSDLFENTNAYKTIEEPENSVSEPIIAYDVLGKPLTLKQYNEEIDKAIEDIENGRFISHEDLLKEIKSWRNEI